MKNKAEKLYTVTKKKKTFFTLAVILLAALIFLGIMYLSSKNGRYLGNTNTLGVGRDQVYPFVFTDTIRNLYVVNEDNKANLIDDSVYDTVHDYVSNKIYYLRNSSLFEYSIEKNSRTEICADVVAFYVMFDRKAIVCKSSDNNIKLLKVITGEIIKLTNQPLTETVSADMIVLGKSHILFTDNYVTIGEESSADLMMANESGDITKVDEKINYKKGFKICNDDDYILYYVGDTLVVRDLKGKLITEQENYTLVEKTAVNVLLEPKTTYVQTSENVYFSYIYCNTESENKLKFIKRRKIIDIDENVKNIILYSSTDYIFYTKESSQSPDSDAAEYEDLYMSVGGTKPIKIVTVPHGTEYIYDEYQGYIYFKKPDLSLSRIYVKDRALKIVTVSENCGVLSVYKNRPFITYKDINGTDTFIVLDSNVVERYPSSEVRLYGSSTNKYLIYKKNDSGTMVINGTTSLDLYDNGTYTRISNNISYDNIFFDRNFENIIYYSMGKLQVWNKGTTEEILTVTGFVTACNVLE